jgi:hypothetical protein
MDSERIMRLEVGHRQCLKVVRSDEISVFDWIIFRHTEREEGVFGGSSGGQWRLTRGHK